MQPGLTIAALGAVVLRVQHRALGHNNPAAGADQRTGQASDGTGRNLSL